MSAFQNLGTVPGSKHMQLGAILAGLNRQEEAVAAMTMFLVKVPHYTVARERAAGQSKFANADDLDLWLGLIHQAGLSE